MKSSSLRRKVRSSPRAPSPCGRSPRERRLATSPWHAIGGVAGWAAIAPTQAVAMRPGSILFSTPTLYDKGAVSPSPKLPWSGGIATRLVRDCRRHRDKRAAARSSACSPYSPTHDDSDEDAASSVFDSRRAQPAEKLLLFHATRRCCVSSSQDSCALADVAEVEVLQPKRKIAAAARRTDASARILRRRRCCRPRFGRRQPRAHGRSPVRPRSATLGYWRTRSGPTTPELETMARPVLPRVLRGRACTTRCEARGT